MATSRRKPHVVDVIAGVVICRGMPRRVDAPAPANADAKRKQLAALVESPSIAADTVGTEHGQLPRRREKTQTGAIHYSHPCDQHAMACHSARVQCSRAFHLFRSRALAMRELRYHSLAAMRRDKPAHPLVDSSDRKKREAMYKLYSMQRSGNSYKVRLALALLKIGRAHV